jgi:hypothetical protein
MSTGWDPWALMPGHSNWRPARRFAPCSGRTPRRLGLALWPPSSRAHVDRLGFLACLVCPSPGGVSVSRIIHAWSRRPGILCPGAHKQLNTYVIQSSKALPGNHFGVEYTPCRIENTMVPGNNKSGRTAGRDRPARVRCGAMRTTPGHAECPSWKATTDPVRPGH